MSSSPHTASRKIALPETLILVQWVIALLLSCALHEISTTRWIFVIGSLSIGGWAVIASLQNNGFRGLSWQKVLSLGLVTIPATYLAVLSHSEVVEQYLWSYVTIGAFAGLGFASAVLGLKTDDLRPLFRALVVAGVAVTLEGLWQMWQRTPDTGVLFAPERFWHQGNSLHVQLRLGSGALPWAAVLSNWLNFVAACCLALIVYSKSWKEKSSWGLALFVIMAGVFFGGSRIPIFFFVLILLAFIARKPGLWRWLSGTTVALMLLSVGGMSTMKRSLIRGDGSMRTRFYMWKLCMDLIKERPIFGGGPNAFRRAWPAYTRLHGYGFDGALDPHSLYFWALTTGGFALGSIVLLLAVGTLWNVVSILRSTLPGGTRTLALAMSLGAVSILLSDVIGVSLRTLGIQSLMVMFVGLVTGLGLRAKLKLRSTD